MRGTEKQIKYANDIIDRVEKVFKTEESRMNQIAETQADKMTENDKVTLKEVPKMHEAIIENMNNEYAGNIIEWFKNTYENSDYGETCARVLSYEITYQANLRNA